MLISVIVCTRNRSHQLQGMLESLQTVALPKDTRCEIIVVDNGSTDSTSNVVEGIRLKPMELRHTSETRTGLSLARNAGVRLSCGDIIMFVDDDVLLPDNWIEAMCMPILLGRAHAVAGGVKISSILERPWMSGKHRELLSSTEGLRGSKNPIMFGANMAVSRKVLNVIGAFDEELGAGTKYSGEDTLFSLQVHFAGFRIAPLYDVAVTHAFNESKLTTTYLVDSAARLGRFQAYLWHHWLHQSGNPAGHLFLPLMHCVQQCLGTVCRHDFISDNYLYSVEYTTFIRQWLAERKRPRNYTLHGPTKKINPF